MPGKEPAISNKSFWKNFRRIIPCGSVHCNCDRICHSSKFKLKIALEVVGCWLKVSLEFGKEGERTGYDAETRHRNSNRAHH